MADFVFKISPNIILGSYTTSRLGQHINDWGKKFMLILDPILKEGGVAQKIRQSLDDRKIEYFVYDEISGNADSETLKDALTLARDARVHGIIAAGGGRTLSIAKAVCAFYNETYDIYDFFDGDVPKTQSLPLICLPTTIRDAFIFTDYAPITDARSKKISLLKTQNGVCRLLLWDPNLQVSLTPKQISFMSVETLAFIIEGYLSQKATFFSDMLLEKAIQLLAYGTDGTTSLTITTPQEVLLSQGGCMASLGCSVSSVGAATLLSYAINSRFQISRSLTSAIFLPYIIEDCATFKAGRLANLARLLGAAPQDSNDSDAVAILTEYVRQKIAKINIPARLKELSLTIEQLSLAVEDAGSLELMNSLPRSMTADDLFELVKKAF